MAVCERLSQRLRSAIWCARTVTLSVHSSVLAPRRRVELREAGFGDRPDPGSRDMSEGPPAVPADFSVEKRALWVEILASGEHPHQHCQQGERPRHMSADVLHQKRLSKSPMTDATA